MGFRPQTRAAGEYWDLRLVGCTAVLAAFESCPHTLLHERFYLVQVCGAHSVPNSTIFMCSFGLILYGFLQFDGVVLSRGVNSFARDEIACCSQQARRQPLLTLTRHEVCDTRIRIKHNMPGVLILQFIGGLLVMAAGTAQEAHPPLVPPA